MASYVWPPALPQLVTKGTRYWVEPDLLETDMDVGPAKARLRSTKPRRYFSTRVEFTGNEYATWETFFENISYGVSQFEWTDPTDGTTKNCRLRKVDGVKWKNRMAGSVTERTWSATLTIEILSDAT
jgi:hypothetical protein